jgi:hypothetical protein
MRYLLLVIFMVSVFTVSSSAPVYSAWEDEKKTYDQGFQDARSGKPADSSLKDNDYYADGYSKGAHSLMATDSLI